MSEIFLKTRSLLGLVWLCLSVTTFSQAQSVTLEGKPISELLSQSGIDTTSVDSVRSSLLRKSYPLSYWAALFLAERGHSEDVPSIRSLADTLQNYELTGLALLQALVRLGDPTVKSMLQGYVDSIHSHYRTEPIRYSAFWGCSAVDQLIDLNDFSRFRFLYDVVDGGGTAAEASVAVMRRYAEEGPQPMKDQALAKLADLVRDQTYSERVRYVGLTTIGEFTDRPETLSLLLLAMTDGSELLSGTAIEMLMARFPPSKEVFDFLTRRLRQTPSSFDYHRMRAVDHLKSFPYPDVLAILRELAGSIANDTLRLACTYAYEEYSPPVPAKSLSVSELVEALITYKHQVGALNWLADANFVNELDNGLDNAKKHIARGDSVNCYKEIQTFQDKVNKEYQRTIDDEKKGKPRDKRFVTVEGWKFLYSNSQYIMDRLPSGKR